LDDWLLSQKALESRLYHLSEPLLVEVLGALRSLDVLEVLDQRASNYI
jgi:hypothetical protein